MTQKSALRDLLRVIKKNGTDRLFVVADAGMKRNSPSMASLPAIRDRASRSGVVRSRAGTIDSDSGYSELVPSVPSTPPVRGSTKRPSSGNSNNSHHNDDVFPVTIPYGSRSSGRKAAKISRDNASPDERFDDMGLLTPLTKTIPAKYGVLELVVERQPEGHHRARYQKEGSRGCIKDRTGNSCPAVQLKGIEHASILQIFVATESGKVRPHPLYRACKVGGKNSTPCRDRTIQNINVLEMDIKPENDGFVNIDCMGILKLRNADLEATAEADDTAGRRKKREPGVRLVFRAITRYGETPVTLQVCSIPVCCTPTPGVPEIHRISHKECLASGGLELIILGRNFVKDDTKMFIQEVTDKTEEEVVWQREVTLQREFFHAAHMVAAIPPYHNLLISQPVNVQIVIKNKAKVSEPYPFSYSPDEAVERLLQQNHLSRIPGVVEDERKSECRSMMSSASRSPSSTIPAPNFTDGEDAADVRPRSITMASTTVSNHSMESGHTASFPPIGRVETLVPITPAGGSMGQISYYLQAPGGNQPIFITIPNINQQQPQTPAQMQNSMMNMIIGNLQAQMARAEASSSPFTPQPTQAPYYPSPDTPTNQPSYDAQQMKKFLQSFNTGELRTMDVTQMNEDPFTAANAETAADELFAQLLSDIMDA
ncbi:hypothetical protein RvY_02600 [Ramazzottius varieornatus]|uniref:RHD domain-containing protein n=1 Tax=Ramazzottius varieornatus TaxID=947166 RepID=A0A1D1UKA1_RAMVA|nr:hypothetical protein RvY_02600 [Ramazzottius varieornatus]